jgi:MFS family permease
MAERCLLAAVFAILQSAFRPEDRGRAIGAWSGLSGIADAVGPFLGGWLSWRWVFLINLPLAIAVVALAVHHVPESRDPTAAAHIDLAGAALGAVGLGHFAHARAAGRNCVTRQVGDRADHLGVARARTRWQGGSPRRSSGFDRRPLLVAPIVIRLREREP